MPELEFHPASRKQLDQFISRPSHALIIVGPEGIGKTTTSRWLAMQLLGLPSHEAYDKYPYQKLIEPDGQSISIESVRELSRFMKLKVAANRNIQRIAIIDQAQLMTTDAQNALLKLLEEPPEGSLLVLTATHEQALLPTIRSRAQTIVLQEPLAELLIDYFSRSGYPVGKIRRALLMSGGLPGLMNALLEQDEEHPMARASQQAREVLRASTFERLALVDPIAKQRVECGRLLFMLGQMSQAALGQTASSGDSSNRAIARWHRVMHAAYDAETALRANAQPKLVLTNLMLNL